MSFPELLRMLVELKDAFISIKKIEDDYLESSKEGIEEVRQLICFFTLQLRDDFRSMRVDIPLKVYQRTAHYILRQLDVIVELESVD